MLTILILVNLNNINQETFKIIRGEEITCRNTNLDSNYFNWLTGDPFDNTFHLCVYANEVYIEGPIGPNLLNHSYLKELGTRLELLKTGIAYAAHPELHDPSIFWEDIIRWGFDNYNTASVLVV